MNADGTLNGNGDITGFNMFAYCSNNPVMYSDSSGKGKILNSIRSFFKGLWVSFNTKILKKEPLPYKSVDEAAVESGKTLNSLTQNDDMEHAQGIVYDKSTDSYGLTDVVDGEHASVGVGDVFTSTDFDVVALVHSHPHCNGHIGNEFSNITDVNGQISGDWAVCDFYDLDLYLASPNGELYVMKWDVGQYNQTLVSEDLPVDDSIFNCTG